MKLFRYSLCAFAIFLHTTIYLSAQKIQPVKNFGANPGNLKMYLYSPPSSPDKKMPLLVVLHGCLQSAGTLAKQAGWNKLADAYGFKVLYPQQKIWNNPMKCFCWYNRNDIEKGKGESFSIKQMIDEAVKSENIDSTKIFVTGLSAGAAMGVSLMADYPETFNAGAIFAGGAYKSATNIWNALMTMYGWRIKSPEKWGALVREQNPNYKGEYPRMIIYQGKMDAVVNKRNGSQLMKQWTNLHHLSTTPTETINRFAKAKAIEKNIYRDTANREAVIYYRIKRLGHALLVDPGKCFNQGGRLGLFSTDKNYFSSYWTLVDFGLIHLPEIEGKKEVRKNENNLTYTISSANENSKFIWSVPKDCKVTGTKDGNSITVSWGEKTGNVDVQEILEGKCKQTYPTLLVKVQ